MRNTINIIRTTNNTVISDYHPFTTCYLDNTNVSNELIYLRNNYEYQLDANKKKAALATFFHLQLVVKKINSIIPNIFFINHHLC